MRSTVLLPAGVRAAQSAGDPFPRLQEKGAIAALIDCWGVARPGAGLCPLRELLDAARLSRSAALVIRGESVSGNGTSGVRRRTCGWITGASGDRCPVGGDSAFRRAASAALSRSGPASRASGAAFGLTPGRSDDPFLVAVAVLTLVSEVSAGEGLLCLVDDAQWLDGPSADAPIFVARRLDAEQRGRTSRVGRCL